MSNVGASPVPSSRANLVTKLYGVGLFYPLKLERKQKNKNSKTPPLQRMYDEQKIIGKLFL